MNLAKHEWLDADANDNRWCLHCGCLYHPQMDATCLQRAISPSDLMPEPKRREFACDDVETIHARLAELAKERLPVQSEMPDHMDYGDCCG